MSLCHLNNFDNLLYMDNHCYVVLPCIIFYNIFKYVHLYVIITIKNVDKINN